MRIPESIEKELIKQRKRFNEQAAVLNQFSSQEMAMPTRPESLSSELQFWDINDDDILDEFLLKELPYALLLAPKEFEWSQLPEAYAPLVKMMEFELECMSDGWGALNGADEEDMKEIISAFRYFGLVDEANALSAVFDRFVTITTTTKTDTGTSTDAELNEKAPPEHEGEPNDSVKVVDANELYLENELGAAYGSVKNATPEIEDRLAVLRDFVRSHKQQFFN